MNILEGVIVHRLFEVDRVEDLYLVSVPLKSLATGANNLTLVNCFLGQKKDGIENRPSGIMIFNLMISAN